MPIRLLKLVSLSMGLYCLAYQANAKECIKSDSTDPLNLTIPVIATLPVRAATAPTGTTLYVKEASLAQLTGVHRPISGDCMEKLSQALNGRIMASQSGFNTFATSLPGIGIRMTAIYDNHSGKHKEWVLPFNASLYDLSQTSVTTDELKLRLETIKTGDISGGTATFRLPSFLNTTDNKLVVNLQLTLLMDPAHCDILLAQPQIELPAINAKDLANNAENTAYPINVNLKCLNTRKASLTVEGLPSDNKSSIFKNVTTDNPASGVGIEMLYNNSILYPGRPIDITLNQEENGMALPLTTRYAKTNEEITGGNVKAQITLRINYL